MARFWPETVEYCDAVQTPAVAFADPELQAATVNVDALGLPRVCSGNFATVFQLRAADGTRAWAVKCFTRQVPGLRERYQAISGHLAQAGLPITVDFQYLTEGIRIRGEWFPVLKMHWVEGQTLHEFVQRHHDNRGYLGRLLDIWLKVEPALRKTETVHGDLQHGNVLLVPGKSQGKLSLRLIDYDGLWTPALAGTPSGELGHAAYQHPQRARHGLYTADLDRFPHLVIAAALKCLTQANGKDWWKTFDRGDNLLFTRADFETPAESELLHDLWATGDDELRAWAGLVALAAVSPLEATPLLEQRLVGGRMLHLTPEESDAAREILDAPVARRPTPPIASGPSAVSAAEVGAPVPPELEPTQLFVRPEVERSAWLTAKSIGIASACGLAIAAAYVAWTWRPAGSSAVASVGGGPERSAAATDSQSNPTPQVEPSSGTPADDQTLAVSTQQGPPPKAAIAPFDASEAQQLQRAWADHLGVPVEFVNSIGMKFRLIPPGEFLMGAPDEQLQSDIARYGTTGWFRTEAPVVRTESPQRPTVLTRAVYIGALEVTQQQYAAVMGSNPSEAAASGTENLPVESVSWDDASAFCSALSRREGLAKVTDQGAGAIVDLSDLAYRLPTEAEWEFAAAGGSKFVVWDDAHEPELLRRAWLSGNSESRPHPVGNRLPNAFGLHDTLGNVWELCYDGFIQSNPPSSLTLPLIDPIGPADPSIRQRLRKGCSAWCLTARGRTSVRGVSDRNLRAPWQGFRVAISVPNAQLAFARINPTTGDINGPAIAELGVLQPAIGSYNAALGTAAAALLKEFDAEEQRIMDANLKIEEKIQRHDVLTAEKTAFESSRALPKTAGLQSAVKVYQSATAAAEAALQKEFDAAEQRIKDSSLAVEDKVRQFEVLAAERSRLLGGTSASASTAAAGNSASPKPATLSGDYGLEFDGQSAHVEIQNFRYTDGGPITLEAVVTPYALRGMQCVLVDYEGAGMGLALPGSRWSFGAHGQDGLKGASGDQPVDANHTIYVAAVFDGTTLRLFVQGRPQSATASVTAPVKASNMPFLVGANPNPTKGGQFSGNVSEAFQGRIDAVRISRGALYQNAYAPPPSFTPTPQTLVLLNFEEGQGDVARDESGHGYDGNIVGATWKRLTPVAAAPMATTKTGAALDTLTQLTELESLDLTGWTIDDADLRRLQPCRKLTWLTLSETNGDDSLKVLGETLPTLGNYRIHTNHKMTPQVIDRAPRIGRLVIGPQHLRADFAAALNQKTLGSLHVWGTLDAEDFSALTAVPARDVYWTIHNCPSDYRVKPTQLRTFLAIRGPTRLVLEFVPVEDGQVSAFVGLPAGTTLDLRQTRLTDAGIAQIRSQLPQCKVEARGIAQP
jgi:formylglycine-generating enzyme required for sulfatase activity